LIAGSALGYAAALGIYLSGPNGPVGAILLNMAVFGAVIAYILQMASFILLRWRLPRMERPFLSPFGIAGALIAALISTITLVTLFLNPDYNRGILGAAAWFVLGIAYFAFYARKRLILAPEEQFAVSQEQRHESKDPAR
jgi:ethanolamine permease